jgi:hypothetical protein
MLADEPALQLVRSHHLADDQIVGAVVAAFCRFARERARFLQDDFMSVEQATQLTRHAFAPARRTRNARFLDHVVRQSQRHSAQCLHSLGQRVRDFELLAMMLVEQEVQPVEAGAAGLPVCLLVQVAQRHGVRHQSIERAHGFEANHFVQTESRGPESAVRLHDLALLGCSAQDYVAHC